MASVFSKIISGEWPGRFVWADQVCVAFATIEPTAPGHVLVVPREPYPKWTDTPHDVASHLMGVAHIIGQAQEDAFRVPRAGLVIAGFEVPHTHLHVIPLRSEADILFTQATQASAEELDDAMHRLRDTLIARGHGAQVPHSMNSLTLQ